MAAEAITPGTCYRLTNAQVIRVLSVFGSQVRYDVFDETRKDWVQSEKSIPAAMLKELETCPVPLRNVRK